MIVVRNSQDRIENLLDFQFGGLPAEPKDFVEKSPASFGAETEPFQQRITLGPCGQAPLQTYPCRFSSLATLG